MVLPRCNVVASVRNHQHRSGIALENRVSHTTLRMNTCHHCLETIPTSEIDVVILCTYQVCGDAYVFKHHDIIRTTTQELNDHMKSSILCVKFQKC